MGVHGGVDPGPSKNVGWYQMTTPLEIYRYVDGIRTLMKHVKVSTHDFNQKTLCNYTWYEHPKTHQVFATRLGKRVYLQDVIKGSKGPWIHVNGDPDDYTSAHLIKFDTPIRTVKRRVTTSGTVGVCYVERRDRWKATLSGKLIGYYKTEEEAVAARLRKLVTLNPMIKFVPEGTDPDGRTGMKARATDTIEGGRPDVYVDQDDAESLPNLEPISYGSQTIKDRDFWKSIPPPYEF